MPLAAFKKMNEQREMKGLSLFANPRNATAGTVRQLESKVTAQRRLDYFAHGLLQHGRAYFDRHSKTLDALDAAGLKVNPHRKLVHSMEQDWDGIGQWQGMRDSLPYELDGVVVQVDRLALRDE